MKKTGLKHLGLYAISYCFAEIIVASFFVLATIEKSYSTEIWAMFGWLQFCMPLAAGLIWLVFEGLFYAEAQKEAQEEWNKRVEKAVKKIEEMTKNEKVD